MREKDYKKSPLKKKPLRQAGQSLDEKINLISDEKLGYHLAVITVFVVLTLIEWFKWFFKTSIHPIVLSISSAVIISFSIRRIFVYIKDIKRLRMARDGELYPCWFVSPQPKGSEVWVLNEKAFPAFLEHERSLLSSEEVHAIAAHLSRYVRNTLH